VHLEHRRFLELAADAELGDLRFVQLGQVGLATEQRAAGLRPGLA